MDTTGLSNRSISTVYQQAWCKCGQSIGSERFNLGYRLCLVCGEKDEQQEIEKHKEWLAKANAGQIELGFDFEARLNIIKSNLWKSIRDLLPEGRQAEVLMSLQKVYLSNTKIDLDEDNLDSAMVWQDTMQGHHYWENFHTMCRENDKLPLYAICTQRTESIYLLQVG